MAGQLDGTLASFPFSFDPQRWQINATDCVCLGPNISNVNLANQLYHLGRQ